MSEVATKELTRPIAALWAAYWEDRSGPARNALIMHYLPLVKFAAQRLYNRRGRTVEIDDLVQYGTFGLKDAINSFDPSRGFKFETYCSTRVKGAMLDGLKSQQWLPRDLRQKLTRFSEAHQSLMMENGVPPADEEIAGRLGVCPDTIRTLERNAVGANPISLFTPTHENGSGRESDHADSIVDYREELPTDLLQRDDVKELFLRELTRNERLILMLYYYEEMTMREIGETLGISGTRVSQMHTEIIHRLREKLECRVTERAGRRQISLDI
jgi:RNA polymerase sigma factor for flagellar operon FliA